MKSYSEYLAEISKDEILEGLLGFGLFPDKIPPFLNSQSFYEYYVKEKKPKFATKQSDYIRYESMRNISIPRMQAIPNPFVYATLCEFISTNWSDLQNYFEKETERQTHKVSRIHIRKMKDSKKLFEMNYGNRDPDPIEDIIISNNYKIDADISSCFPSIYTHSLPWAIMGKEMAKKNKGGHWSNMLDTCVRNLKYGETNGLLIGPHASNLLAEIVLVAVDKKLFEKGYRYVRHIDDYICYVETHEKAEAFLLDLAKELKEYELYINHKKIKITKLPIPSEEDWINKLNNFYFGEEGGNGKKQTLVLKKLKAYVDLAVELVLQTNNAAILNYAIKIIHAKPLGKEACRYYLKRLHHLLLHYPYLAQLMENYVFDLGVDVETIKKISEDLYNKGVKERQYEACSYAIYWSIRYELELAFKGFVEKALESEDCIFLLLAFLRAKKDRNKQAIESLREKARELAGNDMERYWLFVYQALPKDELAGDFKAIKNKGISFLKKEIEVIVNRK